MASLTDNIAFDLLLFGAYITKHFCGEQAWTPTLNKFDYISEVEVVYFSMQGLLAKRRCRCRSACFRVLKSNPHDNKLKKYPEKFSTWQQIKEVSWKILDS